MVVLTLLNLCFPDRRHRDFHRNNAYDLMRGFIVVIACLVLQTLQISRVYHYIRGQVSWSDSVIHSFLQLSCATES